MIYIFINLYVIDFLLSITIRLISYCRYYDILAHYLTAYNTRARKVYLGAAPDCPHPDKYLDAALKTGLFDYVWVLFYNNPSCGYNPWSAKTFFNTWNYWASTKAGKVFIGLPSSPKAVKNGYIPPNVLKFQVLPSIKKSPKYGGVMLWSRYWDKVTNYGANIKPYA